MYWTYEVNHFLWNSLVNARQVNPWLKKKFVQRVWPKKKILHKKWVKKNSCKLKIPYPPPLLFSNCASPISSYTVLSNEHLVPVITSRTHFHTAFFEEHSWFRRKEFRILSPLDHKKLDTFFLWLWSLCPLVSSKPIARQRSKYLL